MDDKLRSLEERFRHLTAELADPDVLADRSKFETVSKGYAELEPVVAVIGKRNKLKEELSSAEAALAESAGDPEMAELAREEISELSEGSRALEDELRVLLMPKDPNDEKNVIIEVRAGTGGDEASLFASELLRAYLRYVESLGFRSKILSSSESSVGGLKEAIVEVEGKGAYSKLKHESGIHRVQRVPKTEAAGRIHTSAASIAVMPEVEEVEVDIPEKDIRVDYYCSSGPGGQSVNTTYSAVRLTHLETKLVVQCQDEKSQHKNKASAMRVLRARLYELKMKEQHDELAADRKSQVGTGDRSEKIRTYNFPQGRVTDHRVPITSHRITEIMNGDFESIIAPVVAHFQALRLQEGE